jgi:hypothetical protein
MVEHFVFFSMENLGGDRLPPKLFLTPAKDDRAPPEDDDGVGGAVAPSASPPSRLAGGRRIGAGKARAERGLPTSGYDTYLGVIARSVLCVRWCIL